jgi:hypothetical protein
MKISRNIHCCVWQLLGGLNKFKMVAVAMVTNVQNGHQIQKSSDMDEIWYNLAQCEVWECHSTANLIYLHFIPM